MRYTSHIVVWIIIALAPAPAYPFDVSPLLTVNGSSQHQVLTPNDAVTLTIGLDTNTAQPVAELYLRANTVSGNFIYIAGQGWQPAWSPGAQRQFSVNQHNFVR